MGAVAGLSYTFAYRFHVPLFFFLAGCSEYMSTEVSWKEYLVKSFKNIMIPFYFFALMAFYSITIFLGNDLLAFLNFGSANNIIHPFISAIIIIAFVLGISKKIENVQIFQKLGQNTLYLCGTEWVVNLFLSTCLQLLGVNIEISNPVAAYIYTFVLLIVCYYALIPFIKSMLKKSFEK